MLQKTANRTAYLTSLVISFLSFLMLWITLIRAEVFKLTSPDTVAVSSSSGGSGEQMPEGTIISLKQLMKFNARKGILPAWQSVEREDGSRVWPALVFFSSKNKNGVQPGVDLTDAPTYGVVEGKYQFFPILIKEPADKKELKAELPSGPVAIATGTGVAKIDEKESSLIKSLIDERESRAYFRQMIGTAPVKEVISGDFIDAYSPFAPRTPCIAPTCYVYKPMQYKDFYKFNLVGRRFGLVLAFDGDGAFQSADYSRGGPK